MKLPSKIIFADQKTREAFEKLKGKKAEEKLLYASLEKAFEEIGQNAFCGTPVQKKLIPKEYKQKYKIDNLWKYNLSNAWRLLYSIERKEIIVLSIVLEWMNHKDYERKFGYRRS